MMKREQDTIDFVQMGERIKQARKKCSIKQFELAEMIGIKPSNLSNIERGEIRPSLTTLAKISTHLHVTVDYLLCDSDKVNQVNLETAGILSKMDSCGENEIRLISDIVTAVTHYQHTMFDR